MCKKHPPMYSAVSLQMLIFLTLNQYLFFLWVSLAVSEFNPLLVLLRRLHFLLILLLTCSCYCPLVTDNGPNDLHSNGIYADLMMGSGPQASLKSGPWSEGSETRHIYPATEVFG